MVEAAKAREYAYVTITDPLRPVTVARRMDAVRLSGSGGTGK
jgi:hypothetical protein